MKFSGTNNFVSSGETSLACNTPGHRIFIETPSACVAGADDSPVCLANQAPTVAPQTMPSPRPSPRPNPRPIEVVVPVNPGTIFPTTSYPTFEPIGCPSIKSKPGSKKGKKKNVVIECKSNVIPKKGKSSIKTKPPAPFKKKRKSREGFARMKKGNLSAGSG